MYSRGGGTPGPLARARVIPSVTLPVAPRELALLGCLPPSLSLATTAVDVFEAIEISTYPSSATKCEEFSIRVPGLNPPRERPLTVRTIHILSSTLLHYPLPSAFPLPPPFASFLTPPRSLQSPRPTFSTRRTLQRTRGERQDDNTDVAGVTEP